MTCYRPIAQTDPARSPGALTLAGGWCWFDRVEVMERGRREIIAAHELPEVARQRLTDPRPPLHGLTWDAPRVMGIVNATPDSFSDGGTYDPVAQGRALAADADLLDIGGESTRPGAQTVAEEEEIRRIRPVMDALRGLRPLSIDTRKAAVAKASDADMVNDVSAMLYDSAMAGTVARMGASVCLMHAQGVPETMQDDPRYSDVLLDVYDHLAERIAMAEAAGIPRSRIVVDPGIGFGKTMTHNLTLIRGLSAFHGLGCPILLGVSRKGFIGRIGQAATPADRMPGSVAVALAGVAQGAQILRVHDVGATRQALALWIASTGEMR
ncbi:dihydropteroate synthase [Falsirhodobacter sp. 20TX0035]|uniref:dihydropteroate synthase n=1 Tax=Falsirhodobacter sp. 20TX0035 TaxID=3022019 RepID=UPI00232C413C|nr:dihydropteroate synthase [Falsirhodobacter sp. 20TX0035]MDB6454853.1 dihydropteroate synthase [Falsirhodobacter sp. 20TX0035]